MTNLATLGHLTRLARKEGVGKEGKGSRAAAVHLGRKERTRKYGIEDLVC